MSTIAFCNKDFVVHIKESLLREKKPCFSVETSLSSRVYLLT